MLYKVLIVSAACPVSSPCKRYRIRMCHQAPVKVAACCDAAVECVDKVLAVIFASFLAVAVPLLLCTDINTCICIFALNCVIADSEALCILICVGVQVCNVDIVPFISCVNFISYNPVIDFSMCTIRVALCKESCRCCQIVASFLFRCVEHIIRRSKSVSGKRMNKLRDSAIVRI